MELLWTGPDKSTRQATWPEGKSQSYELSEVKAYEIRVRMHPLPVIREVLAVIRDEGVDGALVILTPQAMTNPTTAGVVASYAMLGDVQIAGTQAGVVGQGEKEADGQDGGGGRDKEKLQEAVSFPVSHQVAVE